MSWKLRMNDVVKLLKMMAIICFKLKSKTVIFFVVSLPSAWCLVSLFLLFQYFAHQIIQIAIVNVGEEAWSTKVACTISATNISIFSNGSCSFRIQWFSCYFLHSMRANRTKQKEKLPWTMDMAMDHGDKLPAICENILLLCNGPNKIKRS